MPLHEVGYRNSKMEIWAGVTSTVTASIACGSTRRPVRSRRLTVGNRATSVHPEAEPSAAFRAERCVLVLWQVATSRVVALLPDLMVTSAL